MQPDTHTLNQLVQRIVEVVAPLKIILFGSAVRGDMGPDSDIDVLIVMPEGVHRRKTAQNLHTKMSGIPFPIDILVTTPTALEKHKNNIGLIYHTILKEGKEIYAA